MRHTGVQVGGSILLAAPGARPWQPARLLHLAAPAVRSPEANEEPIEMGLSPEHETMRRRLTGGVGALDPEATPVPTAWGWWQSPGLRFSRAPSRWPGSWKARPSSS